VTALRVILGDQLTPSIAALSDADTARDIVLMAEVMGEATYVRHHKKKLAFVFSAMRHFAADLSDSGFRVDYVRLDDPANTGSLRGEVLRAVARHHPTHIVATAAGEYRLDQDMRGWSADAGVPVDLRDDDRFFCSILDFKSWAAGRKTLRMETFYRLMRTRTGLLMGADGQPDGGRWNFDQDNRKTPPPDQSFPSLPEAATDVTTCAVLDLVETRFGDHFGDLHPFRFSVSRAEAEAAFDRFCTEALPWFGDYQDAMRQDQPVLFHAVISQYLNIGLLDARTVCHQVEAAYRAGTVPLNAAEGFIRQILGWREFVRGVYWLKMPDYAETNHFAARRPLPAFYWTGATDMNCLRQCIDQTKREAYAHHIQRLMVLGLFGLLAGIDPRAVNEWFLIVYADAYEWVELPNVQGMALYADGGLLASKPYAASGKYIQRMSDYCRHCRFTVNRTVGADACPFNALYWDFLVRHRDQLSNHPRIAVIYRTLDRWTPDRIATTRQQAADFLNQLR